MLPELHFTKYASGAAALISTSRIVDDLVLTSL
jgi:hypothetical protein